MCGCDVSQRPQVKESVFREQLTVTGRYEILPARRVGVGTWVPAAVGRWESGHLGTASLLTKFGRTPDQCQLLLSVVQTDLTLTERYT